MADTRLSAPPRSPLAHAADRLAAATRASRGAVRLAELPFLAQVNVRPTPRKERRTRSASRWACNCPSNPTRSSARGS